VNNPNTLPESPNLSLQQGGAVARSSNDDKLRAVALYQQGIQGVAGIARNIGRSRAAVAGWIRIWKEGGSSALLSKPERSRTAPYRFTIEARTMLLERARKGELKSCRDAWRWLKFEQGVDVCYLTVWRFLSSEGLFEGEKMHARVLTSGVPKDSESHDAAISA
jgi:transposase-like protein